jgi:hypothetical protein
MTGAVASVTFMLAGYIILHSHMSGFDGLEDSFAAVGAVGGAIVNGSFLFVTGICATPGSLDFGIFLAYIMAGFCTTIASSCVGVAILHHMPGGTPDISHAIVAAVVGYSVVNSWALLFTICLIINKIFCNFCCEFTLALIFLQE